jgi:hypothetical protein
METAFWLGNLAVVPFWLLMIFAPHWSWTQRIIAKPAIILPALLVSVIWGFIVLYLHPLQNGIVGLLADFASVTGIATLATVPNRAIVLWLHILVFDLFAGRWIYLDSRQHHYSAWWVSPLLLITVNAAPLGCLIYMVVRWLHNMRATPALQAANA